MKIIFTAILLVIIASTISYSFSTTNQGNWRWRNDDGNESGASFIAGENTGFTLNDTTNIRLRLELYVWDVSVSANNLVGIYYSTSADATSGTWTKITNDNSNAFVLSPSVNFTDGDAASSDLLNQANPGHSEVPGLMIDSSTSFFLGLGPNQSREFEICFRGTGNIAPNTQFYFSARNDSNNSTLDGYAILPTLTTSGSLPVELISFSAKESGSSVRLEWQTATEVNNYGFEIQRLKDLKNGLQDSNQEWAKIGFVKGGGNSNSVKAYSFVDNDIEPGYYQYKLKQIDNDGKFEYSKIVEVSVLKTIEFSLEQNYPNPFNPTTTISFSLPAECFVDLGIYDVLGNEVMNLVNEQMEPGRHSIQWNASSFSSGVYFYRLQAGLFMEARKLLLLR